MNICEALRQALRSGEPVVAPLCYDPLTSGFPGDPAGIKMLRDEI